MKNYAELLHKMTLQELREEKKSIGITISESSVNISEAFAMLRLGRLMNSICFTQREMLSCVKHGSDLQKGESEKCLSKSF